MWEPPRWNLCQHGAIVRRNELRADLKPEKMASTPGTLGGWQVKYTGERPRKPSDDLYGDGSIRPRIPRDANSPPSPLGN